jgi:hypothetical protein
MAFEDVFGEADQVAQHLYDFATEDPPGSVAADISGRIARKTGMSTDPWRDYE